MKNDELFEIIGEISDRHIEGAKKRKTRTWKKWTALAACFCIVVAAMFMVTLRVPVRDGDLGIEPDYREDDYPVDNGTDNFGVSETSDKYANLYDFLEDVSKNDDHSRTDSNRGYSISSNGDAVVCGAEAVVYNGYVYRVGDGCVEILNFDGETVGTIDFAAREMFISGDRLALLGGRTEGNEFEYESYSIVRTYMLRDPANPDFMEKYEQKGEYVACYMANDKLYLLTADGVCACGYSRLEDVSGYVPTFDGEPWNQNEITILGEPTSVNYLAVSATEMTGGISAMRAFYGDIEEVFYGEDWVAIAVKNRNTQPEIYTFDERFGFTGKIEIADIIGVDKNVECDEKGISIGDILSITAVSKHGDVFSVLGEYSRSIPDETKFSGYSYISRVMIAAKNMVTDETSFELVDAEADSISIDDIFFDENRVIICISTIYNSDDPEKWAEGTRFVLAELGGSDIIVNISDFITDRVCGVENYYAYGSPYGSLETLIPMGPMGNGVYLRFNGKPNGFDIFDFSDIKNPKLLYQSNGELSEGEYFDFIWQKLDDSVFGVMHMKMGAGGEIRETEFSYRIYRVDPYQDEVFLLLNEYTFGKTDSFSSSSVGFEVFEYEGEYYFITQDSDAVTKIEF